MQYDRFRLPPSLAASPVSCELLLYALSQVSGVRDAMMSDGYVTVSSLAADLSEITALLESWDYETIDCGPMPLATEESELASLYRCTRERAPQRAEDSITQRIKQIVEHNIMPIVQTDGGSVEFLDWKSGIAYIQVGSACARCPQALPELRERIEQLLRFRIPEVRGVVLV